MIEGNEKETVGQAETLVSIPGPGPMNPLPSLIDWSRPVQTKGGRHTVRIIAIDHSLDKPVVGVIEGGCLSRRVSDWMYSGVFCTAAGDWLDLENIPEVPHV